MTRVRPHVINAVIFSGARKTHVINAVNAVIFSGVRETHVINAVIFSGTHKTHVITCQFSWLPRPLKIFWFCSGPWKVSKLILLKIWYGTVVMVPIRWYFPPHYKFSESLRLPHRNDAKIAKICECWTFWPVIQPITNLFKIWQKAFFFWILKRWLISWITSKNVQKFQIFAISTSFPWGNLKVLF